MTTTNTIEVPETPPVAAAPTLTVVPNGLTREGVTARIMEILEEGRGLDTVTAAEVLNLTPARIEAAKAAGRQTPAPNLTSSFISNRQNTLGMAVGSGVPLSVVGAGGRNFVKERLSPLFTELGITGIIEIIRTPGARTTLTHVPANMAIIQMADQYSDTTTRVYGTSIQMARDTVVSTISASPNWEVFAAPWNPELPAYAIKTSGNDCVGRAIVMFLNFFGTNSGQFIRSERGSEPAFRAFTEIMRDAAPRLENVWRSTTTGDEDVTIAEMALLVDTIKNFGASALGNMNRELEQEKTNLVNLDRDLANYQERMITAANQRREAAIKIEMLEQGGAPRVAQAVTQAVAQMEAIRGLNAVRNVQFTTHNNKNALLVELYDCSVKTSRNRRTSSRNRGGRILCADMAFFLILDPGESRPFLWDNARKNALRQASLHPNIYQGGDTCWGELSPIITRKLAERDWVAVTNLAIRMVQSVGYPEATRVSTFPTTDLTAGFQYPGRV